MFDLKIEARRGLQNCSKLLEREIHRQRQKILEQNLSPQFLEIGFAAAIVLEMHYDLPFGSFEDSAARYCNMKIKVLDQPADSFAINVRP